VAEAADAEASEAQNRQSQKRWIPALSKTDFGKGKTSDYTKWRQMHTQ